MIKKLVLVIFVVSLFLVQSCINEISCTVQQNNQVIIFCSSTMPYIIYDFMTQSSISFTANLSQSKLRDNLEKVNGVLLSYKTEQRNDKGFMEMTVQLPSFGAAQEVLDKYGIKFNYSLQTRRFEWDFRPMKAFIPSDLSNFMSLIIIPFSQKVRVTIPFRIVGAQNGAVTGSSILFNNTFISLDDFFSSAVYTINW